MMSVILCSNHDDDLGVCVIVFSDACFDVGKSIRNCRTKVINNQRAGRLNCQTVSHKLRILCFNSFVISSTQQNAIKLSPFFKGFVNFFDYSRSAKLCQGPLLTAESNYLSNSIINLIIAVSCRLFLVVNRV